MVAVALCRVEQGEKVAVDVVIVDHADKVPGRGNLLDYLV